jgi:hypothetical protein
MRADAHERHEREVAVKIDADRFSDGLRRVGAQAQAEPRARAHV